MPVAEKPLTHIKGDTFLLRGVIRYDTEKRELLTNADLVEFSISTDDDIPGIIYKSTLVGGVSIDDEGGYLVTIPPEEIERDSLPLLEYRYALRWTNGTNVEERFTFMRGPFFLNDVPFSL
jgi:hypothetical protein